ncbi:MAG: hypothetical protein HFI85_01940 [Clostridia bacterium]|nr:hypothetical protein [Clostridia bacterium]
MAKGNVKKGFATYIVILFMAIVAAFFILVAIMLFSPFKSILGFKYFIYRDEVKIKEVEFEKEKQRLDFSNLKKITINCGFADVKIEKRSLDNCYIQIENNCSGFAREDMDTDFVSEVNYTSSAKDEISVKIREPEGFVYFNKGIVISLLVPQQIKTSFENTVVDITNTDGTVYIGNQFEQDNTTSGSYDFSLAFKSLNIKNKNGKVLVYANNQLPEGKQFVTDKMFVKTNNGDIEVRRDLTINDFSLYASKARITFNSIYVKNAKFDLGNSDFVATRIKVDDGQSPESAVNEVDLIIDGGYFTLGEMIGSLSTNEMTRDMGRATIKIRKITGNISFPNANNARITIDETANNSQILIRGKDSTIKLNKFTSKAWLETTGGSVSVNAGFNDTSDQSATMTPYLNVKTYSGAINVVYNCQKLRSGGIDLLTTNGAVNLKVRNTLSYYLMVVNTSNVARDGKNVSVEGFDSDVTFPLKIQNGSSAPTDTIKIMSNKNVKVSLI